MRAGTDRRVLCCRSRVSCQTRWRGMDLRCVPDQSLEATDRGGLTTSEKGVRSVHQRRGPFALALTPAP